MAKSLKDKMAGGSDSDGKGKKTKYVVLTEVDQHEDGTAWAMIGTYEAHNPQSAASDAMINQGIQEGTFKVVPARSWENTFELEMTAKVAVKGSS